MTSTPSRSKNPLKQGRKHRSLQAQLPRWQRRQLSRRASLRRGVVRRYNGLEYYSPDHSLALALPLLTLRV